MIQSSDRCALSIVCMIWRYPLRHSPRRRLGVHQADRTRAHCRDARKAARCERCAFGAPGICPHLERGARLTGIDGLAYKCFEHDTHPLWFSYSFNPSIVRIDLWRRLGPFAKYETEEKLSGELKKQGMRIALLWPPIGRHIGDDRHVPDPFQPQRPRNILERLARSAKKRLTRLSAS